jgi:hypothetical protein
MDTTERIINAGLKGAIGGAFIMLMYFGIKALYDFFNREEKIKQVEISPATINQERHESSIDNSKEKKRNSGSIENDDELWAEALRNFETNREPGLYARLYAKK